MSRRLAYTQIVIIKNPADFIGQCLGKSEAKTRAILQATIGKVLIIDEAHMLDAGGPQKQQDQFRTAVIDTLVAEVQSVPGEDRCILMLGYEENMRTMFQNVNPGLSRRFESEDPFRFQDFDNTHLETILELKLKEQDLSMTKEAREVACDMLNRARMRPNFSNGSEVEQCLSKAKFNYQNRQSQKPPTKREFDCLLIPEDLDPYYRRTENDSDFSWLENTVSNTIIAKLKGYHNLSRTLRRVGRDPRDFIPTNFIFKGPPGE